VKVSILAQIEEVERELAHRRQVYPSLVASRSLRQSVAEFQTVRLEAVRATLVSLRDNEAEIREIMAERRRARGEAVTIEVISHEESCEVRFSDGRETASITTTTPAAARSTAATRRKQPLRKPRHLHKPSVRNSPRTDPGLCGTPDGCAVLCS
jgi:hypothetical protein